MGRNHDFKVFCRANHKSAPREVDWDLGSRRDGDPCFEDNLAEFASRKLRAEDGALPLWLMVLCRSCDRVIGKWKGQDFRGRIPHPRGKDGWVNYATFLVYSRLTATASSEEKWSSLARVIRSEQLGKFIQNALLLSGASSDAGLLSELAAASWQTVDWESIHAELTKPWYDVEVRNATESPVFVTLHRPDGDKLGTGPDKMRLFGCKEEKGFVVRDHESAYFESSVGHGESPTITLWALKDPEAEPAEAVSPAPLFFRKFDPLVETGLCLAWDGKELTGRR